MFLTMFISFSLIKIYDRVPDNLELSKELKLEIYKNVKGSNDEEIINYSLDLTSKLLEFSYKNDIKKGKANCVGYSKLCSSICNYGFKINNSSSKTKPVVGYIKIFDINLCKYIQNIVPKQYKNFVKDHDFVEYTSNNKIIYFDPLLYDYTGGKLK